MAAYLLRRLILLAVLLPALGLAVGWLALRLSLPQSDGRVVVTGLAAEVSIGYDQWQRPYVSAQSLEDALQAQGWLHAAHRLWQMELLRRAGQGRAGWRNFWARIFCPPIASCGARGCRNLLPKSPRSRSGFRCRRFRIRRR